MCDVYSCLSVCCAQNIPHLWMSRLDSNQLNGHCCLFAVFSLHTSFLFIFCSLLLSLVLSLPPPTASLSKCGWIFETDWIQFHPLIDTIANASVWNQEEKKTILSFEWMSKWSGVNQSNEGFSNKTTKKITIYSERARNKPQSKSSNI